MTLAEMNSSGDMEPEGPTSCSQAGPPVRDKDTNPPIKTFDPKFVLSKRNAGTKMKQRLRRWLTNNQTHSMGKHHALTLLMILLCL